MADTVTPISGVTGMVWPALPGAADANILALLFQLEQSQWWTPDEIFQQQLRQAGELVAFAARTVPFYRSRPGRLQGAAPAAKYLLLTVSEDFTGIKVNSFESVGIFYNR